MDRNYGLLICMTLTTLIVRVELSLPMSTCEFEEKFPSKLDSPCFKRRGNSVTGASSTTKPEAVNDVTTSDTAVTNASSTNSPAETDNDVTTSDTAATGASSTSSPTEAVNDVTTSDGSDQTPLTCPDNMVYGNCTCQGTCEEPFGTSGCYDGCNGTSGCFCPEGYLMRGLDCVQPTDCPCYWSEWDRVIPNNQSLVNANCTETVTCVNQTLSATDYMCSNNAQCNDKDGTRQCYCNIGYIGDGQNCTFPYKDCQDLYLAGFVEDGIYTVLPTNWSGAPFNVSCVMGGTRGWTVFQRRVDGGTDFYRDWTSYRDGFGQLYADHWLGNEKIHYLTKQKRNALRIDFVNSEGDSFFGFYDPIEVDTESNQYSIYLGRQVSGNAGGLYNFPINLRFSTYDNDNDKCGNLNCAMKHRAGWWFQSGWCSVEFDSDRCIHFNNNGAYQKCDDVSLNGVYNGGDGHNIFAFNDAGRLWCRLQFTELRITPW